ncbi:hypothetical protein EST38_g5414 [Candolleomyces aberdarensis]|uniref:Uncharacterized protein n=1 Tax=Candolleomyces aberdarensis TaxID=2316362 RepID=A0A4Q2DKL0_9AGAR|nr:hypothetical protein EST38_g5414 [Candolleomyces aberdarensis]
MKFSATFAVLAVLSVRTFVSAFPVASMADDFDLEMRDEFNDGELYDVLARELLDYSDELEGVDARDLDADEDFLYVRVPVYGMRLDPLKMAKNTGETRLQNAVQKVIDQKLRPQQPQIRIARPTFQQVAQQVVQQNRANRRPNAAEIGRQITTDFKNLQQKIDNVNAAKRK